MEPEQKQQIDQAIQELRKALHWRAELCAQIAQIIESAPQRSFVHDVTTGKIAWVDLPYQHEAEQLEQADQLIARLMHQIQMVSMPPAMLEWQRQRNEVISAERMATFAKLDLLKPVMLDLDVLPFDE